MAGQLLSFSPCLKADGTFKGAWPGCLVKGLIPQMKLNPRHLLQRCPGSCRCHLGSMLWCMLTVMPPGISLSVLGFRLKVIVLSCPLRAFLEPCTTSWKPWGALQLYSLLEGAVAILGMNWQIALLRRAARLCLPVPPLAGLRGSFCSITHSFLGFGSCLEAIGTGRSPPPLRWPPARQQCEDRPLNQHFAQWSRPMALTDRITPLPKTFNYSFYCCQSMFLLCGSRPRACVATPLPVCLLCKSLSSRSVSTLALFSWACRKLACQVALLSPLPLSLLLRQLATAQDKVGVPCGSAECPIMGLMQVADHAFLRKDTFWPW